MPCLKRALAYSATILLLSGSLTISGCSSNIGGQVADTASISGPATGPKTLDTAGTIAGAERSKPTKIALLLPLAGAGDAAQIARGMKEAAELALFEANDPSIQLIGKDDGGTPDGARKAAESAINEGADFVLGPLFGKSVSGAAPVTTKAGVPLIAFSNDPAVAQSGVHLLSFMASEEVARVVAFAASKGKRRFAALIPADSYGQTVEPAFRKAVKSAGGEIVQLESYSPGATAMLASAKRVFQAINDAEKSGKPVDALFVPAGPDTISQLGPLISYSGIDTGKIKLIGTSAWELPLVSRDDQLIGAWYAGSEPASWQQFSDKFRKTFGRAPPRLATLSYDAMQIVLELAGKPGPGRFSESNLTRPSGFSGVDGPVRLLHNGLTARSLAVMEIEKYRSVVIDAAPQSTDGGRVSDAAAIPKLF
jgi:branched-chain amino acid transport system substrate-binding protein